MMLYSVSRQFIYCSSGKNIIGGAPDLGAGFYQLNQQKKPFIKGDDGLTIMQKQLEELYKDKPYNLSQLNYEDGKVKIKGGKIEKYSEAFADKNSDFLQYIWFH